MAGYNHFQLHHYQPHLSQLLLSSVMIQLGLFLSIKVGVAEIMPKPYWFLELGLRIVLILNYWVGSIWLWTWVIAAWVIKTLSEFGTPSDIVTFLVIVKTCDMAQVFGRSMRALMRAWVLLVWWPVWHLIWHLIITPISGKGIGRLILLFGLGKIIGLDWSLVS